MRCRLIALVGSLGLALTSGCGGSDAPPAKTQAAAAPAPGTSGSVPTDPVAMVVYEFFDAVRKGSTVEANKRLTPLSLERITALDMNIAPPGSPTASFQVGKVTKRENDHALISLTWTDLDADGKPYHEPILCELRVCDGQWRICGMAQDLGPGHPPMVMDFESLEGIASQAPAKTPPAAGTASTTGSPPGKQIAQDPFQQPVQR